MKEENTNLKRKIEKLEMRGPPKAQGIEEKESSSFSEKDVRAIRGIVKDEMSYAFEILKKAGVHFSSKTDI